MTPPPGRLSEGDVTVVDWGDEGGSMCAPIWTESGRSQLVVTISVRPKFYGGDPEPFWDAFVSSIIDEHGETVLAPNDAPAPSSAPYPDWFEQREGQAPDDPRIPRGAFTGATYGIRFGQLFNGIRRVHPDEFGALDELNEGQAAIVLLGAFFDSFYGDGIDAAYQRLAIDGAPRRLSAAAELVGAATYADVFARVEQSLPPGIRDISSELRSHLEDREAEAWDASEDDSLLQPFEDQIYRLEDDGDLLWQHIARYVEQHPDQFFTPG